MKLVRVPPLFLALAIQLSPILGRISVAAPRLTTSPIAIVLNWVTGTLAAVGAMHAVSGATLPITLLSENPIEGAKGTKLPDYLIRIGQVFPRVIQPVNAWDINGVRIVPTSTLKRASNGVPAGVVFPPGLSLILATGIVTGTPTEAGSWTIDMRGWEKSNRQGASTDFSLTFEIADPYVPTVITSQPASKSVYVGEDLVLSVGATGEGTLTYAWKRSGTVLSGQTGASLALKSASALDSGDYTVTVMGRQGTVVSKPAKISVVGPPLAAARIHSGNAVLHLEQSRAGSTRSKRQNRWGVRQSGERSASFHP